MTELLGMDEPRRHIAAMISGLDIHYDLGEGHPLLGRRMPDLDLHTADGPTRVFTLLHDARPVLLNLGEPGGFDIAPWANRVRLVDATHDGVWELPVIGEVAAPAGRVDPTRRACRLGRRPHGPRAASSTGDLVRRGHSSVETTGSVHPSIAATTAESFIGQCGLRRRRCTGDGCDHGEAANEEVESSEPSTAVRTSSRMPPGTAASVGVEHVQPREDAGVQDAAGDRR